MSQPNFVPVHRVDAAIVQWISKNSDLCVAVDEESGEH